MAGGFEERRSLHFRHEPATKEDAERDGDETLRELFTAGVAAQETIGL